ncbi:MAG: DinB family protein [Bryobacteraceae bacterium]
MSTEPWLRGPLDGVHPLLASTLHAYQQAREDLAHWTAGLSDEQIWARPHGLAPVGFQLRHIAGSVDRLTTYLKGGQLSDAQMDVLQREADAGRGREELLSQVDAALRESEEVIRAIHPATLAEPRTVGRKRLPTTVAGLLVHLAEHTQRHVGQAIITAKLLRT